MLDLIFALLIAMGVFTTNEGAIVIDQQTGISYGVGTTAAGGTAITTNNETPIYYLILDDKGEYHLVRR